MHLGRDIEARLASTNSLYIRDLVALDDEEISRVRADMPASSRARLRPRLARNIASGCHAG